MFFCVFWGKICWYSENIVVKDVVLPTCWHYKFYYVKVKQKDSQMAKTALDSRGLGDIFYLL